MSFFFCAHTLYIRYASISGALHRIIHAISGACTGYWPPPKPDNTLYIRCSAPDNTCHIRCAHRIRPQTPDSAPGYPDMAPDMAPYPVRVTDMAPYPVRCTGCVVICYCKCYVHRISVTPYPVTISGVWHRMWSSYPVHSSWRDGLIQRCPKLTLRKFRSVSGSRPNSTRGIDCAIFPRVNRPSSRVTNGSSAARPIHAWKDADS